MPITFTIFTDGGARGNPGPAACAYVVWQNQTLVQEQGLYLGRKTNNEAEYLGLLSSLKWLQQLDVPPDSVTWKLDSLLVVEQMSGRWKIKNSNLKILRDSCFLILDQLFPLQSYEFVHVPREQNRRADELVNLALDSKMTK